MNAKLQETLCLTALEAAGVEVPAIDTPAFESFRKEWWLSEDGIGGGVCCPNAISKDLYLAIGPDNGPIVTVDISYSKAKDNDNRVPWSRWGSTFSQWFDDHWREVWDRWLAAGIITIRRK